MFKHLTKTSKYPIGIDIGAYAVRLVQLEQCGSEVGVAASSEQALDLGLPEHGPVREKCVAEAIHLGMAEGNFKGNRVVTSIPANQVIYKNIRIPVMPANELKAAVAWEAADRLHLSPDDVQLQYHNVGEVRQGDENKQEIILLAVTKKNISEHVALLTECNLTPLAVESAPSALARWANYHQSGEESDQAIVVLDLGYDTSKILICHHGRVLFYKQIESAGRQINQDLAGKLDMSVADIDQSRIKLPEDGNKIDTDDGVSDMKPGDATLLRTLNESMRLVADELTRELNLCLRYYGVTFRGHRPEHACVTGGMSREPMFLRMIQESSGMILNVAPMLNNQNLQHDSILASGLAMRLPSHSIQGGQAA
ncbi:MAG: pilus assembly protein PilM [Phycisphaeraceae bacterium]|nr:pilus assembly protein PilM [Phycisphaeraceae bacterium]